MILSALRAKLREKGLAATAGDAVVALASATFYGALYGVLAGTLVAVAIPFLALELLQEGAALVCRCANSHDECRCGRGAP